MANNKFRDRYRVSSARLPQWNYASMGWYFVTICTKNRECLFGEIIKSSNGDYDIQLSDIGKIARSELFETQVSRPNIVIDTFVIMPNHVHLLLEISDEGVLKERKTLQPGSLGAVIGWWKSAVTKGALRLDAHFGWQSRFYDVIVRNETDLNRIRRYIQDNPKEWYRDRNKPSGVYM
jgi:REP element-mobilizing transposase RayT